MPDAKALQMGTSHMLSQSFAHAFEMKFQNKEGQLAYPWLTSWGATTRLVGALVMTHGDDKGLVLPPKIAPIQVVIIPIYKTEEEKEAVLHAASTIQTQLGDSIRMHLDDDEQKTPGNKFHHWELKGVPLRLELGPRDLASKQVMMADRLGLEKRSVAFTDLKTVIVEKLDALQKALFYKAKARLDQQWSVEPDLEKATDLSEKNVIHLGFCGNKACEELLKPHKLSVRCILQDKQCPQCALCGKPSVTDCIVARSY